LPFYIFCAGLRLSLCCEHIHCHNFVEFVLVACKILWKNCTPTEF
jgi:hypothetical protein